MSVQADVTGIERTLESDIQNGKHSDGYIKVCASWVYRLWKGEGAPESSNSFKDLNMSTSIFDSCGAYNKYTSDPIAKGSEYSSWSTALDFLEWYQVQHMNNFGIIIVDDLTSSKYERIQSQSNLNDFQCFNRASLLASSVLALLLAAVSSSLLV
uniref:Uncharacterized protein n=1 Tax=Strombidium rassoulzadegani TaxID=1082188 RepID=A0A7S3CKF6_9SPIT|mmetsp:Transcript_14404/g.24546  ORF Transcript_14404/g.24546 Transcript_14404/m.24546 type:complete len:155 (+) Transcript_14404:449-913(+)